MLEYSVKIDVIGDSKCLVYRETGQVVLSSLIAFDAMAEFLDAQGAENTFAKLYVLNLR